MHYLIQFLLWAVACTPFFLIAAGGSRKDIAETLPPYDPEIDEATGAFAD